MVLGIIYESICRWIPPAKMVNATGKIFNNNALDPETGELVPVEIPDYLSIQMEMKNGMRGSMLLSETGCCRIKSELGSLEQVKIPGSYISQNYLPFRELSLEKSQIGI